MKLFCRTSAKICTPEYSSIFVRFFIYQETPLKRKIVARSVFCKSTSISQIIMQQNEATLCGIKEGILQIHLLQE